MTANQVPPETEDLIARLAFVLAQNDTRSGVVDSELGTDYGGQSRQDYEKALRQHLVPVEQIAKHIGALRCRITGNLVGTDTWMVGAGCNCDACSVYRALLPRDKETM